MLRPIPLSRSQVAHFVLATDHYVAKANAADPSALERYRWETGEVDAIRWPSSATVVKLRPLDDWQIAEAEEAAEMRARRTPAGEDAFDSARLAGLAAVRAEQTAAKLEGRRPAHNVFAKAWSTAIADMDAETHRQFHAFKAWRRWRNREICRRAIVSIIMSSDEGVTVRQWLDGEAARLAREGQPNAYPVTWVDGEYPLEQVERAINYWLSAHVDGHKRAAAPALAEAERARIEALRAILDRLDGDAPRVEEIEAHAAAAAQIALVDLDKVESADTLRTLATARGVDLGGLAEVGDVEQLRAVLRVELPKADRYPEMTAAVLRLKTASDDAVWLGATNADQIWSEIADHAVRLSRLGKGGSSSSTPLTPEPRS